MLPESEQVFIYLPLISIIHNTKTKTMKSEIANLSTIISHGQQRETGIAVSDSFRRALGSVLMPTSLAVCLCLASCVSPNVGYVGASATYTTHSPGYRVNSLPRGYRSETISGSTYYYQNGNYYRRSTGGYIVIEAPRNSRYYAEYGRIRQGGQSNFVHGHHDQRGDVITRLPNGHRVRDYRGTRYYEVGDRYYILRNGSYTAVRRPF